MKIELNQNKIFFNNGKSVQEIHPFWLRERVDGDEYLDKGTQQRLFDPSQMDGEIIIKKAQIKKYKNMLSGKRDYVLLVVKDFRANQFFLFFLSTAFFFFFNFVLI